MGREFLATPTLCWRGVIGAGRLNAAAGGMAGTPPKPSSSLASIASSSSAAALPPATRSAQVSPHIIRV